MTSPMLSGKHGFRSLVPLPKGPFPAGAQSAAIRCYPRWLLGEVRKAEVTTTYPWAYRGTQPVLDTGTLRGDVIALLSQANASRSSVAAVFSVQLSAYYQDTGKTPAELREHLLRGHASSMQIVIDRALERGEVGAEHLSPRIISLPFDLVRHEALMTLEPIPAATIAEIVDDIFLPLVRQPTRPD